MKNKVIKFDNEKDIKSFDRKIWLYKGIFYKNVNFILKNNTENKSYDSVINALNIKKYKKRIEYIYDAICEEIDNYNSANNINCEFKDGQCMVQHGSSLCNGCCLACPLQTSKGCPSKNVTCKMFVCSEVKKKYNTLKYKDLKVLKCLSLRNNIIIRDNFFVTRESFLNTLYWGSLIIYCTKITINLFRIIKFSLTKEKNPKKT